MKTTSLLLFVAFVACHEPSPLAAPVFLPGEDPFVAACAQLAKLQCPEARPECVETFRAASVQRLSIGITADSAACIAIATSSSGVRECSSGGVQCRN